MCALHLHGIIVARACKQAFKDTDELIDKYKAKFEEYRRAFDSNNIHQIQIECIQIMDKLEQMEIDLKDIPYAAGASFQSSKACLPGTRKALLDEISQWIIGDKKEQIFLLTGGAGTGKSTVAHTIARQFKDLGRLGSPFFFGTGGTPLELFGTIARDLSALIPEVRARLSKVDTSSRNTPDIADQFKYFLLDATSGLEIVGPVVIVIDALDESGDIHACKRCLEILANNIHLLPPSFRFLLTSRPDPNIEKALPQACKKQMERVQGTSRDISEYIFATLKPQGKLLEGLPTNTCEELAKHAGDLFQWASVACNFIKEQVEWEEAGVLPSQKFSQIILNASRKSTQDLNGLYREVLNRLFPEEREAALRLFHSFVGPILASYQALSMKSLSRLLSEPLENIQEVLKFMGPFLDGVAPKSNLPIRPLHQSFYEFLTTSDQAGRFFINLNAHHQMLLERSLDLINHDLTFNYCRLQTSHKSNLDQKYDEPSVEISYACQYFGKHLEELQMPQNSQSATRTPQMDTLVHQFLTEKLLAWFEVLSILRRLDVACPALLHLARWMDSELCSFAEDAAQFILYFGLPIAVSAPHIYLSAMPFAPSTSLVAQNYQASLVKALTVTEGKLNKWPAQQMAIHTQSVVHSLAFSPDGRCIASGSWDNTVRVWNAQTGEPVGVPLTGHEAQVNSVAFSPDGKYIASGSDDKTIRVWNAETREPVVGPLTGHENWVTSVAFSPDGKYIASGSWDNTIRLWNAQTGEPVGEPLTGHENWVTSVAFSPDGKYIASGSWDNTIRVWNAQTGEPVGVPLTGHEAQVNSVAFSPDGKYIASGSHDKTIRVWNAETREPVVGPLTGHELGVSSVAISPDGKEPVGEPLTGHGDLLNSVAFSPDGKYIASGSDDKTIRVWNAQTREPVGEPLTGHGDLVNSVAFSPDGKYIASGSDDKTIRVWNAQTREPVVLLRTAILDETGWLRSPGGDLLLWIPPVHRKGFLRPNALFVIGAHQTRLNLDNFVHGEDWVKCIAK
ncbi:hypothetical protein GLOTRDRAFT_42827 [Gloeophyllum trabeum ATCC 11539]|uniref:NACHT domain-containing protein n=1 Tax=Gloeophyllum trabeum (strain ATCC 11539 / FP-39264 / Madison 617) TaxID=670483 RepID=S7Q5N0_GLOTA|nr:uncharacterized protein GLOTRDRAFT_42827 [Gloeophyllum trabeum ATCC 11539]EPQ54783.1 hypothetical protein GLOTRDRAFT_42827 [Gloeophyllum trabeum ATCC 11539]